MNFWIPVAALLLAAQAGAATFVVDPMHSNVSFKIRHLMTRVPGRFSKFSGTVEYEPGKPDTWKVDAEAAAESVDTNNSYRDGHLRKDEFFDAKRCPKVTFKSTKFTDVKGDTAKMHGDLTIRCVTKPVTFDLEIGGMMQALGSRRLGALATARVNRKDWGLNWNEALEAGGMLVGDDVDIELDIQAAEPKESKKLEKAERKDDNTVIPAKDKAAEKK